MLKKMLPEIILCCFVLLIALLNVSWNYYFIGWDNLLPEFNIWLNLKRSVFSVWEEYQGLGLLAGNGHAAELPRQLFLLPLSFFLPIHVLRPIYILLMLLLGSLGTYRLILYLLKCSSISFNRIKPEAISLFGGLYYILNLSTLQTFYTAFEPFVTHYAALPWLVLTCLIYIKNHSRKALLFLVVTNILAIPQGQVPTVFIVYLMILGIILMIVNFQSKNLHMLKTSVKLLAILILLNAFWLLPFLYFALTNASVAVQSKINQMATETVYLQNKEFGYLSDVFLLKGYWLNTVDLTQKQIFDYLLLPWRNYISQFPITLLGYILFSIISLGVIASVKKRNSILFPFTTLFLFSVTMLAISTPPFSWFNDILRNIPLFSQVFRFPFTKFSTLASLMYSIFFSFGLLIMIKILQRVNPFLGYIIPCIISSILIVYMFPIFTGHFFYNKQKLTLPQEYVKTFEFFNKQDPATRIAYLPQHTFWGWNFYNWGYSGSGFLWYGIPQPITDRAFDVWSNYNENYYYDISNAIYTKNVDTLHEVLNKYSIGWLVIDKNIIYPPSPESLFVPEIENSIEQIADITKKISFGKIDIYQVALKDNPSKFIAIKNKLPTVNRYSWNNYDTAYSMYGNYITTPSELSTLLYPFRSLYSQKTQQEKEFTLEQNSSHIIISNKLDTSTFSKLFVPSYLETETIIPIQIKTSPNNNKITISAVIYSPEIYLDAKKVWGDSEEIPLFEVSRNKAHDAKLNINGIIDINISESNSLSKTAYILTKQTTTFTLSNTYPEFSLTKQLFLDDLKNISLLQYHQVQIQTPKKNAILSVKIPKIIDQNIGMTFDLKAYTSFTPCYAFRKGKSTVTSTQKGVHLYSHNGIACISYYLPNLSHDQGYALFLDSLNQLGRPLHLWISNENEKFSPFDLYLSDTKTDTQSYVLYPMEPYGYGYSFHFDNISIGEDITQNNLKNISIYPLPYRFLTYLVMVNAVSLPPPQLENTQTKVLRVQHPHEGLYILTVQHEKSTATILLSQAFDKGWKAYEVQFSSHPFINLLIYSFPMFFGYTINEHVLINNWSNGWVLHKTAGAKTDIVITYIPQYLEYTGLALLAVFIAIIVSKYILSTTKRSRLPTRQQP